jgi:hypothetical protein
MASMINNFGKITCLVPKLMFRLENNAISVVEIFFRKFSSQRNHNTVFGLREYFKIIPVNTFSE